MHLWNVRKGQFVYFNNQLHQVYSVKPFFKKSVHLIRLSDLEQTLAKAKEIDLYKPKHLDSFTFNRQIYTLDKDKIAQVGDYILVTNPKPDTLDYHYLHAIETVTTLEGNGVITNRQNGINQSEYWVMAVGLLENANAIDIQNPDLVMNTEELPETNGNIVTPKIGDIFQRTNTEVVSQAMVVAINDAQVFLGDGTVIDSATLLTDPNWTYVYHLTDDILASN